MSRDRLRIVGAVALAAATMLLAAPVMAQSGSPPASASSVDPLLDSLLQAGQLPSSLTAGAIDEPPAFDIDQPSFDAHDGLRAISRTWSGTQGPVMALFDFRMLFPSEAQATAYLDAAESVLSEQVASGLDPVAFEDPIGEDARHYFGVVESGGQAIQLHNYLFRVGPIAAKVFVAGIGMREDTAPNLAGAAKARIDRYLLAQPSASTSMQSPAVSAAPAASVAIDDATRQLLGYVPEGMRATCQPSVSPMTDDPAVECVDGGATVSHTLFEDVASRDATFTMAQSAVDAVAGADSCAEGPYSGPYALGPNGAGNIVCLSDGTQVVFLWARDGVPVLSFAVTDTLDQAGMFEWWLEAGPNPETETD